MVGSNSHKQTIVWAGNTKGGSITVQLTSCLTGLESAVWQLTIFVFICKTDKSKPVKQEVNSTVILPPLVFPGLRIQKWPQGWRQKEWESGLRWTANRKSVCVSLGGGRLRRRGETGTEKAKAQCYKSINLFTDICKKIVCLSLTGLSSLV
jgi:hypothetical protein